MHHAPSVSYPVGRCSFQRRLWWAHSLLSLSVWLAWGWSQPLGLLWACTGVALAALVYIGWRAWRPHFRAIQWDGAHWRLDRMQPGVAPERVGQVKAVLDLQNALLLRWQPLTYAGLPASRWLWLARESQPAQWLALRRAVFARQ